MDFPRFFVYLSLIIFSSWTYSAAVNQNMGIAFVHGTNDHRMDAEGKYWKKEFIAQLAEALPNPSNYLIVHCDFSYHMWHEEAAGCLADQLLQFITDKGLTKLTVYTHSDGGNVIRWILSNPTYDSRFMTLTKNISQVIAIAPSSGGTPLADEAMNGNIFEESLGWLLGYRTESVKQQRIGDMAIFNDEVLLGTAGRPSLVIPFRVVVGSDVIASPIAKASYCNGYFLNAGLKITKAYLEKCADGFLGYTSQSVAGDIWFYDWQKTSNKTPLSHNQSRHSCFGFDQILRNDLFVQGIA